jgi:hypothetical protein
VVQHDVDGVFDVYAGRPPYKPANAAPGNALGARLCRVMQYIFMMIFFRELRHAYKQSAAFYNRVRGAIYYMHMSIIVGATHVE